MCRFRWIGYFWAYLCASVLFGEGVSSLEGNYLSNIRQVTFSTMGFERAGEAYFSPDGKMIVFQAVPKGKKQFQIFIMDLEERIPRLVSTGRGACTCAYFKPDGKKIIFASSHENPEMDWEKDQQSSENGRYRWVLVPYTNIYEANLDGGDLIALTSGPAYHAECAYCSDGTQIVYTSNEDGHLNLYVMNADGSNARQITHTRSCYNGGPFFSPSGMQIVFRADRDLADFLQLFLINSDGTEEKQLTCNQAVNWAPYWHPNGNVIAYTTSIHGHQQYEIYLLNLSNGKEVRLTDNPAFDGLPSFSPDGKRILWTSKRGGQASQVFIADFTIPEGWDEEF